MRLFRLAALAFALIIPGAALPQARPPAQKTGPLTIYGSGSTGDVSAMSAPPDASLAVGRLGRSVFEALQGSSFYVRPYLTDLTCASDQTTALASAILFAPVGAQIVLPPGCISVSGTTTITSRWLRGSGRSGSSTEVRYTAASGVALKAMGDGTQISDLLLTNPVASSTANAIQLADGATNPRGQMVARVRAVGFQDQLDVQSGEFWSATYLDFYNATRYGVRIRNGVHPDSGDGVIAHSVIYADNPIGENAIRLESGGGLKVSTTKTLQFNRSFYLGVADGANTSILMIDGSNSFENPRSSEAIRLGRIEGGTTGKYGHINVEAQLTGSVGVYPGVENVRLAPLTRDAPYGVIVQGGDNVNVSSNTTFKNVDQAVVIQDPATNVRVGDFPCAACRVKISDQRSTGSGRVALAEQRPISLPAPSSGNPYTAFYQIELAPYHGAKISAQVEGLMQGAGVVNSFVENLASHNGTTGSLTQTTAQVNGGAVPIDISFDVASVSGAVRVGVRVPTSYSSSTFAGSITVKIDGRISVLKPL